MTSNSPGEVAGWLTPAVAGLKRVWPYSRISVFLPPCDFASGSEKQVVHQLAQVDQVFGPAQYLRYALTGRWPAGFAPGPRGFVLFLGGDLFHAVWLGRRLGYPVYAYTEGHVHWRRAIRLWFVPNEASQRQVCQRYGVDTDRVQVVGWLPVDAVHQALNEDQAATALLGPGAPSYPGDAELGWPPVRPSREQPPCRLLLLPGSRPAPFRQLLGLFLGVAQELADAWSQGRSDGVTPCGELQVGLVLSPFIPRAWVEQTLQEMTADCSRLAAAGGSAALSQRWLWAVAAHWYDRDVRDEDPGRVNGSGSAGRQPVRRLQLASGLIVNVWQPSQAAQRYHLMQQATLALAIPGTTTLEMAALGLPGLVVLPLQRSELIPLPGLAGMLGRVPGLGRLIRHQVVARAARRAGYLAWPNRVTGREYLPEMRGALGVREIALALRQLLCTDPERWARWRATLPAAVGGPGAAQRLAVAIARDLAARASSGPRC